MTAISQPPQVQVSEGQKRINRIHQKRKNILKLIGLISQEKELGLRELAENLPFFKIDESQIKTPEEMVADLRAEYRRLDEEYQLEVHLERYGSPGLKTLRDKAKAKLVELGIDPDEPIQ